MFTLYRDHVNFKIQIQVKNKLSPLPGFEPLTSEVSNWCATNWSIQALALAMRWLLLLETQAIFKTY